MTNRTAVLTSLLGAATLWSTTAVASPEKPAFCKVEGAEVLDGGDPKGAVKETDPMRAVEKLVDNLCDPDDEGKQMRKELDFARGPITKRLDMTEADWNDAALWVIGQKNRDGEFRFDWADRSLSSMDGFEQYKYLNRSINNSEQYYEADVLGPKLTELGRLGLVENCLYQDGEGTKAICYQDLLAIDYKKIADEIRASKRPGAVKMELRFKVEALREKIAAEKTRILALIDRDPAYKTLFAIGAPITKDWKARQSSDLVLLAQTMDDARMSGSRKAFAGCEEKTWPAFEAAMAALPAKTFDDMIEDPGVKWAMQIAVGRALVDRDVYLAAISLIMCTIREGESAPIAALFSRELLWHPGFRGPRTETHNAILTANLVPDKKSETIVLPSSYKPWFGQQPVYKAGASGRGVVASVKKGAKDAVITFAKETSQQTVCDSWKTSNRISRIDSQGNVEYHGHCAKSHSETVRTEDKPVTVSLRTLTGVKKGVFVDVGYGEVLLVYPKKSSTKPVAVFGVAMKQ